MDQEMDMRNITAVNLNEEQKTKLSDEIVISSGFLDRNRQKVQIFLLTLSLAKSKVKLVSSDGQVFSLDYDCVMQSETIKSLLQSNPSKIVCLFVILCLSLSLCRLVGE